MPHVVLVDRGWASNHALCHYAYSQVHPSDEGFGYVGLSPAVVGNPDQVRNPACTHQMPVAASALARARPQFTQ